MSAKRKAVLIAVIIALVVVIVVLWKSPIGDSAMETIEIQTNPTTTTVTEITTQEIAETTTQENIDLSFSSVKEAKKYVKAYAIEKGYDFKAYPDKLFELMVKDKDSIEYVLDYPANVGNDNEFTIDIEDFSTIPLFIQWDIRWGYHTFKDGVVGLDGCGSTCLSMAAVYLKQDVSLTPVVIADYAAKAGYFVNGSGTSWSLFERGVAHFDLKSKTLSTNKKRLIKAIKKGHPVIASVKKGDFTKKGHYILIAGYENDEFIINDPFSKANSEKRWSWERIEPQIKNMWEIYQ